MADDFEKRFIETVDEQEVSDTFSEWHGEQEQKEKGSTMEKTEETKELYAAMVKAQGAMGDAKKGSDNPFFKSKYSDLASVVHATKEALSDNGLAIMQLPIVSDTGAGVKTILIHESGQSISSDLYLPVGKRDAQGIGSAITYARRYGWQAICGIPSDDDDGNAAIRPGKDAEFNTSSIQEQAMDLFDKHKNNMTPENRQWCMDAISAKYKNYQGAIDAINKVFPGVK